MTTYSFYCKMIVENWKMYNVIKYVNSYRIGETFIVLSRTNHRVIHKYCN